MCEFLQLSFWRRWLRSQLSVSITADTELETSWGQHVMLYQCPACSGGNGSPYLSELSARNFMLAVFRGHKWEDQETMAILTITTFSRSSHSLVSGHSFFRPLAHPAFVAAPNMEKFCFFSTLWPCQKSFATVFHYSVNLRGFCRSI